MWNEEGKFVTCVTEHHAPPVVWEFVLNLYIQVSSQLTQPERDLLCGDRLKDKLQSCLTRSFVSVLGLCLCNIDLLHLCT